MMIFASQQSSHSEITTVLLNTLERVMTIEQMIGKVSKNSKVAAVIARVMGRSVIEDVGPVVIIVEAVPIR